MGTTGMWRPHGDICLKIFDLWRHPHPLVGGWVAVWVSGSISGVRSNH